MMTKYDDDERVGKRIRGRRNWPDSGAAGGAGEIRRRHRGAADLLLARDSRSRTCRLPEGTRDNSASEESSQNACSSRPQL